MRVLQSMALMTVAVTTTHPQGGTIQWTPFTYTSIAGDTMAADTGRVTVPERHGQSGRTIQLPLIRVRSTAARPGLPIIYLAGGPGASGTSGMRGDLFPTVDALRAISDVIIYDQRGTGFALPSLVVRGSLGIPLDQLVASPAARDAAVARARAAADEVRARGIDLTAYNTVESVEDLDLIRQALGVDKFILWGHSYGSHLGLAYIRKHGAHVERAILGGINGLDQRRRLPADGDVLLSRIDSVVRQTPKLNTVMPDFLGATRRVLTKLAANPVKVRVDSADVVVGKEELQMMIAIASGEWSFVSALPLLIGELDAGRYDLVARQVRDVIKARPIGTAMTYPMDMSSGVSPARARRIAEQQGSAILGNAINFPFDLPEYREAWGVRVLPDEFRAPVTSSIPTLFISGTLDGRTSLGDAAEVRRGFANGTSVVVDGAAHNPYALTTTLRDMMVRFAKGERVADARIPVMAELRGPDEPALIAELRRVAGSGGVAAVSVRLREMAAPGSPNYVSSYVPGNAFLALQRQDRKPEEALAVLQVGVELFPRNSFLLTRLGEVHAARNETDLAIAAYRRALEADPFNRVAAVQLQKLGALQ
jgi:pimeloyl-ACP methyl ester carboxylesterase